MLTEPKRLSDYVVGIFTIIPSKKGMKKAIKKGLVKVNGQTGETGLFIRGGELIELYKEEKVLPILDLHLEIIYEDEHLAVINKPAGIVVSGNKFRTIENALPRNLKISSLADSLDRPQAIHRLDYPTSGLLLIGKTRSSVLALNQLFENKQVKKIYHSITIGQMPKEDKIDFAVGNKEAITYYQVIESWESPKYGYLNLVRLSPLTGKRHQLRIHLAGIGHPILGDKQYGKEGFIHHGKGLFLHASALTFQHPILEKEIQIEISLPKKFLFFEKFRNHTSLSTLSN